MQPFEPTPPPLPESALALAATLVHFNIIWTGSMLSFMTFFVFLHMMCQANRIVAIANCY